MDKTLYEYEKKLGLASSSVCTEAETAAIKTVLRRGDKLPEGIYTDKLGRYCKYDAGQTDESEKDRIVMYDLLIQLKAMHRLLVICSVLLAAMLCVSVAILIILVK